jgi:glycosyltransferase involved in cell wall biosynthesis
MFDRLDNWRLVRSVKAPAGKRRQALERFLMEQAPDAMLIEQGHEAKHFWLAAKRLNIPVFVYFRGIDATGYLRPSRNQSGRVSGYREMFRRIDGVFAVSQFLVDELAQHGLSHPNTHVLPSGVDTSDFPPDEKKPGHVLMAGRLIDKKAPLVSIEAFLRASEGVQGAHLHVVGDGPLRGECEDLVSRRGAGALVTFHGHLEHAAVRGLMAQVPIFIQHSVTSDHNDKEGAPTSIQEAMAAGMCVISTLHAGIPDLVRDGVTGRLVAEHDAAAFAQCIGEALHAPEVVADFGHEGRTIAARDFDKGELHGRLETLLQDYVAMNTGSRRS